MNYQDEIEMIDSLLKSKELNLNYDIYIDHRFKTSHYAKNIVAEIQHPKTGVWHKATSLVYIGNGNYGTARGVCLQKVKNILKNWELKI